MFLASVSIKRFRNLEDVVIDFDDGLNVIVGENNIGKTNVLDAIRAALGAAATQDVLRLSPEDRFVDATGKVGKEPILISLRFENLSEDERGEFVEMLNFDPSDPTRSTISMSFEWSYDDKTKRWSVRRWGGERSASDIGISEDLLQALPLTRLDALRDAVAALAPGRSNRLARALSAIAVPEDGAGLVKAFTEANAAIEGHALVRRFETRVSEVLSKATGPVLGQSAVVRAAEPEFEKILSGLRLLVSHGSGATRFELRRNGLGYNNLLYIATVLTELEALRDRALPLLLVEEPEAHLHPQLQTLLVDFLSVGATRAEPPRPIVQTIVTTHSPTIAAHVPPRTIRVLHADTKGSTRSCAIGRLGLGKAEERRLSRMLDVTRATMLFARGVLLVEGISEALLLPLLAQRLGYDLAHSAVSVVPIAGVDFSTLTKLYGNGKLATKVAIVTDGDPEVVTDFGGASSPKTDPAGVTIKCARLAKLQAERIPEVGLFHSEVTFEYDLVAADLNNGLIVHDAWASLYERTPALKRETVEAATTAGERARLIWEAVCLGNPTHGKADLAQAIAASLERRKPDGTDEHPFAVPTYIAAAIRFVLPPATSKDAVG
jgi:putative ATP-dependent endonuclease of the OLD family